MFNLKVYTMKRQRFFEGLGLKVYVTLAICMALLLNVQFLNAQSSTINVKGVVNDAMGPVIGASVVEKGNATNGTITDIDGNFTLNVQPGATIVVSFIGYQPQEIVVGNQTSFKIQLKEDTELLDEVVVVGYGVQKKKLVTGATVEVKGEDIAKLNTTQALGALQSQSPGVNIQAVSGQPGDGFKINIRGAGTNGNTAPVYVIDGVAGGDINALNPADIERIDVLKDAASCAIYGSSGANGVILITTKQGKVGKVSVSYDGNIGWANIYKMPDMLNAKEYMAVMDQVAYNNGGQPYDWSKFVDADLLTAYQNGTNPGTDWVKEFRNKNAVVTNHALNVTGGSEFSKFSTGIGYQYQDGAFGGPVKTDYRRFTFRINSEHVIYRKGDVDVIKFGENIYYQHKQNQGVQLGNQYSNDLSNALRAIPLIPVYNENGDFFMYDDLKNFGTSANGILDYTAYASNPMAHMVYNQAGNNKNKNFNLNTAAYLEVQPLKNLIYKGQVSYKQWSSSWRSYLPVYQINNQGDSRDKDQTINNVSLGWNWSLTNTLSYRFDITDLHHFDVLAGTEYSKSRPTYGESVEATGYNSAFGDFTHAYLHNTERKATATVNGYPSDYGSKMSYFGRLNYDFKETYMFSAIIRADGSSKFAKGNQWGYFPSFSAGWVISNEAFMKNTASWLGFLKVRAGWGQNGNDNIPNSNWRAGYEFGDYGLYTFGSDKNGGTTGAYPNRLANPDLTWETSEQTDLGLDVEMFKNRLSVSLDYFDKRTFNLIQPQPMNWPSTMGLDAMLVNLGEVRNRGFELSIGWNDRINKNFSYFVTGNFSYLKNWVSDIGVKNEDGTPGVWTDDKSFRSVKDIYQTTEGEPLNSFHLIQTAGIFQSDEEAAAYVDKNGKRIQPDAKKGDLKFVDYDGDGTIGFGDRQYMGSATPKTTFAWTLGFTWKKLSFSAMFQGVGGAQAMNVSKYMLLSDVEGNFNRSREILNAWSPDNRGSNIPILSKNDNNGNFSTASDWYLEDASYLRLKNVTLSYDLSDVFCKWSHLNDRNSRLSVFLSGENLATITRYSGMDPECGGWDALKYPVSRVFSLGVKLTY